MNGFPDGTFKPSDSTTRADFVIVMNRALNRGSLMGLAQLWNDTYLNYWAYGEIEEASVSHAFTRNASGGEVWTRDVPSATFK